MRNGETYIFKINSSCVMQLCYWITRDRVLNGELNAQKYQTVFVPTIEVYK